MHRVVPLWTSPSNCINSNSAAERATTSGNSSSIRLDIVIPRRRWSATRSRAEVREERPASKRLEASSSLTPVTSSTTKSTSRKTSSITATTTASSVPPLVAPSDLLVPTGLPRRCRIGRDISTSTSTSPPSFRGIS
eukprot:scaffold27982_cov31-Tisochrysis_lutea.AAC.10